MCQSLCQIHHETKLTHGGQALSDYIAVMPFRSYSVCLILSSLCSDDLQETYGMLVLMYSPRNLSVFFLFFKKRKTIKVSDAHCSKIGKSVQV